MLVAQKLYQKLGHLNYKIILKDALSLAVFFYLFSLLRFLNLEFDEHIEFMIGVLFLCLTMYIYVRFFTYIYKRESKNKLIYMVLTAILVCLFETFLIVIFESHFEGMQYRLIVTLFIALLVYYAHQYGRKIYEQKSGK